MSFFWYDYETFGADAKVDRPVQFAGIRTDEDLHRADEPVVVYCRPAPDYLPRPEACLIHGLTPTELLERGISEAEFAHCIHEELSRPNTCAAGYNAVRFDHEVTRFLLYRNLRDPYAWHWRNGNSRWDLIDLVRAVYALHPAGLQWPERDDGGVSFRLEDVAAANDIRHESPHEALADVETTIELARLIRSRQPDLFNFYLDLRHKHRAAEIVERPFIWISSLIGTDRCCVTLMAPLAAHPNDTSAVIAYDLSQDPGELLDLSPEELRASIFSREGGSSPIYKIKLNACPFVAPAEWLTEDRRDRLGLDGDRLKRHYRALRGASSFGERVQLAYERDFEAADYDVDAALYDDLIPDGDRDILADMLAADLSLAGAPEVAFKDGRLSELVFRYRARNYPKTLSPAEKTRWRTHCRTRHLGPQEDGCCAMDDYDTAIEALRAEHGASPAAAALLDDLADYGRRLRKWLG